MQSACQYSTLFSHLKLAALAKLNYLPSWWFLREMAVKQMLEVGWNVDDRDMTEVWRQTCERCVGVRKRSENDGMANGGDVMNVGSKGGKAGALEHVEADQ